MDNSWHPLIPTANNPLSMAVHHMDQESIPEPMEVASRQDFVAFVDSLRVDLAANPAEWESPDLASFLEALAAYARDVPGYLRNVSSRIDPERPSWELFALVLAGARVYE